MQRKPRPLTDLVLGIVIPSVVLMNLSGPERLGPQVALIVALAFPIGLGLYEMLRYRAINYIALLGLVSVLLTGGIGLLVPRGPRHLGEEPLMSIAGTLPAAESETHRTVQKGEPLLEVKNLKKYFPVTAGIMLQRTVVLGLSTDHF